MHASKLWKLFINLSGEMGAKDILTSYYYYTAAISIFDNFNQSLKIIQCCWFFLCYIAIIEFEFTNSLTKLRNEMLLQIFLIVT